MEILGRAGGISHEILSMVGVWISSGSTWWKFNAMLWDFLFTSQSLRDHLTVALEDGKQANEELEKLKEEIRAERASVQAARVIEKQKREVGINRQVDMFNQSQEAVNQRVDSLITTMGQHSKVEVVIDGVKHGESTNESFNLLCTVSTAELYSRSSVVSRWIEWLTSWPWWTCGSCSYYEWWDRNY